MSFRKIAKIRVGDSVNWKVKVHPKLDWIAPIPAKVKELNNKDQVALIELRVNMTVNSEVIEQEVSLDELENMRWEVDEVERRAFINKKVDEGREVDCNECVCLIDPEDTERAYNSIDEYLEECEENEIEPSPFLWCGELEDAERISADYIVENLLEQFEDDEEVKGVEELEQALEKFYESNSQLKLVKLNYGKYVSVNKEA